MSQTVFLSTVTREFGSLRKRLAALLQRTQRVHVRHQDDFVERGVVTLHMLQEEIERSHLVLHVVGAEPGALPPGEQVEALLKRLDGFANRFPEVAALARDGQVTYTQWEAWLAQYLDKRLCCYRLDGRLNATDPNRPIDSGGRWQLEHAQRLVARQHYPKSVADDDGLYDDKRKVWREFSELIRNTDAPPHLADFAKYIGTPDLSQAAYHARRTEAAGLLRKVGHYGGWVSRR